MGRGHQTILGVVALRMLDSMLVPSPGVGIAVYPRVPRQLVRSRELLAAPGKLASMRFLARVCPDMPCLVLETVESLVAQRALVWARQLVGTVCSLTVGQRPVRSYHCDGSHVNVRPVRWVWW